MRIARILRTPPRLIARRLMTEWNARTDRYRARRRARCFECDGLLAAAEAPSLEVLWNRLAERLHAVPVRSVSEADYEWLCPGDSQRIFRAAEAAICHRVDLLGTGPVELGTPIDWHTDFKTGRSWPVIYMRDIDSTNLGSPSDVKVPWELSRLQWLIPIGQAYLLTGDERYAIAARAVLDDWIASNPYACGVNWACTMEVAMRIITWTWFFHVFCRTDAWADQGFRARFMQNLFLHGEFTERYTERSDINGNHVTAAAAALVFAGLFFGKGEAPARWVESGWQMLCDELPRQVFPDGVNFEASIAYHRLVLELFFLAARYREACGLAVADEYRQRVIAMARFALAYTRPDGGTPLLGDADDARALPFGGQSVTDHRYLAGMVGAHWHVADLVEGFSGPGAEIFWTLGSRAVALVGAHGRAPARAASTAFTHGGCYVMRNARDHVFIDCGPVGQGGRGGHGHNDCLSFEAMIDGCHLISDCGAYLYTASVVERNHYRSTAYHNTPQVDGEELNRFVRPDFLWTLHDDATPLVKTWQPGSRHDVFVGAHTGYDRLQTPVRPLRTIQLEHEEHRLLIRDELEGTGNHLVTVPLHLAPGVEAWSDRMGAVTLRQGDRRFVLEWSPAQDWTFEIGAGRVSPSYGVTKTSVRLLWRRSGQLPTTLTVSIVPVSADRFTPADDVSLAARASVT
jgi:uncharacterized heparinase superfamily protein